MDCFVRSVRFAGVAAVGGLTLIAGAALVWYYVQPEMLPLLSTWQLGAIMGTFVLPLLCFAVWQADRKVAAAAPVRRARDAHSVRVDAVREAAPSETPVWEAPIRQPLVAGSPLVLAAAKATKQESDQTLAAETEWKGSGRLGHRPRQPKRSRGGRAPAHRHRRFADV